MQQDFFINICKTLSLGELQTPVTAVSGGYMHKMYRMETAQDTYAVKLLNPSVIQRPDVFRNLHLAESLEQELQNAHIPIVPANIYNIFLFLMLGSRLSQNSTISSNSISSSIY